MRTVKKKINFITGIFVAMSSQDELYIQAWYKVIAAQFISWREGNLLWCNITYILTCFDFYTKGKHRRKMGFDCFGTKFWQQSNVWCYEVKVFIIGSQIIIGDSCITSLFVQLWLLLVIVEDSCIWTDKNIYIIIYLVHKSITIFSMTYIWV